MPVRDTASPWASSGKRRPLSTWHMPRTCVILIKYCLAGDTMLKPTVFWDTWKVGLPWYSWSVGAIFPGLESNSQGPSLPDSGWEPGLWGWCAPAYCTQNRRLLGALDHISYNGSGPYREEAEPQWSDWMQMSLLEMQMTFLQRALGNCWKDVWLKPLTTKKRRKYSFGDLPAN